MNTAGTYKLIGAALTVGTVRIDIAAQTVAIEAEPNYASHPRTGGAGPYDEYIDSTYVMELAYMLGFGTDGIQTVFAGLEGQEVDWKLETRAGTISAIFPVFTFTATVPALSPLPSTDWGEFAQGDITIPIKGKPVKSII